MPNLILVLISFNPHNSTKTVAIDIETKPTAHPPLANYAGSTKILIAQQPLHSAKKVATGPISFSSFSSFGLLIDEPNLDGTIDPVTVDPSNEAPYKLNLGLPLSGVAGQGASLFLLVSPVPQVRANSQYFQLLVIDFSVPDLYLTNCL